MTMILSQEREVSGVRKKKGSVRAPNLAVHWYRTQSAPAATDVRLFQELRDVCSLEPLPRHQIVLFYVSSLQQKG